MAEHDDDQDPQQPNGAGGSGGDDLPDDPAELKKLLAQTRSQLGRMTNESKAIKKARAELAQSLSQWSGVLEKKGIRDPGDLDKVLSDHEERDLQRAKDTGGEEAQQIIENMRQKHQREMAERDAREKKLEDLLQGVLVDDRLNTALAKYIDDKPGLMEGAFALLRPKVKAVADPDAPRGYSPAVNVDGADMPLEEFLAQWADTNPKAAPYLKPSQATGGGATSGGRPAKQKYRKDMTAKEKSEAIDALGQIGYLALPWAPAPSSGTQR